eukprot:1190010-Prorocentrum_minimum.AAC.2
MQSPQKGMPKLTALSPMHGSLSPTSAISPNALITPNTARSITVNGQGSQSPFLLGANATCTSLQACIGAHVTAGVGSTFGNRTRHSCFTRGVSGLARGKNGRSILCWLNQTGYECCELTKLAVARELMQPRACVPLPSSADQIACVGSEMAW